MAQASSSPVVISLTVADVAASLDFYVNALGAEEVSRMALPDGVVVQAEIKIGSSQIYISTGSEDWQAATLPAGQLAPCLFIIDVENPDQSFEHAVNSGATAIEAPKDQFWGMRTSILADPFGYRWNFRKILVELSTEEIMERARKLMG